MLLERVAKIPKTAKEQKDTARIVLAEGEATGHQHVLARGRNRVYRDDTARVTFVEVRDSIALLEHEEHAPISLEPGEYRVTRQREYWPKQIRRVAD